MARLIAAHAGEDETLLAAMNYGALGPGKRLRPFLLAASAALFDVPRSRALTAAAAIECLHAYSLVHDDLPAMDDDDLRRGRPTAHIRFDEATAILAGDGLLTLAFEILALEDTHPDPAVRVELVALLARAGGASGMIAGQMLDIEAEKQPQQDMAAVRRIQRLKTGALFEFACLAGGVLGGADAAARAGLADYARHFGLAFQITDDLLDYEGDEAEVGKRTGKDAAQGKATFVGLLGAQGARAEAAQHVELALTALAPFGGRAAPLVSAAQYILARRS